MKDLGFQLHYHFTTQLAQYGCDAYGADTYGTECATTTSSNNEATGGDLSFTGQEILLPIVIGILLIGAGVVGVIRMSKKKRSR